MWFYVVNVDNNATEMLVNSIFNGNHGVTVSLNGTNSQKTTQFVPEYQCVFICLLSFIDFFFQSRDMNDAKERHMTTDNMCF